MIKTDYEDKHQPLKRIVGALTAPISGSLSSKVKEEIFGLKYDKSYLELSVYKTHWMEHIADYASILSNVAIPLFMRGQYENLLEMPKELVAYGLYKTFEAVYRIIQKTFSRNSNCSGSLEGTLISKAFIEPFLKKEAS